MSTDAICRISSSREDTGSANELRRPELRSVCTQVSDDLMHDAAGHAHRLPTSVLDGRCPPTTGQSPSSYLRGGRCPAGRPLSLRGAPAQAVCRDAVSRRYLVRPGAEEIQDRIGMLCTKVRKHGFQRAVITETA